MNSLRRKTVLLVTTLLLAPMLLHFQVLAQKKSKEPPPIPVCTQKFGTLRIEEPKDTWWIAQNLESPELLIKFFVMESKCFTIVDRGRGFGAGQEERGLAGGGQGQRGSGITQGQTALADFVMTPDIANKNQNKSGGAIPGIFPLPFGLGGGGVNWSKKSADVVLSLTDSRSSENLAISRGKAEKSSIGFAFGAGGLFGGAGIGSYSKSDMGQVLTLAYLEAYIAMVEQLRNSPPVASKDLPPAGKMTKNGKMFERPSATAKVVRDLELGTIIYQTGNRDGIWREVEDEHGNKGWVSSELFTLRW